MSSARLTGNISDLASDLREIAVETKPKLRKVVAYSVRDGAKLAQTFAREKSGPHGSAYYKRIHGEMTGDLEGEYGPDGTPKTEFVGAGFRHGMNMDLPNSADIIAVRLQRDVAKLAEDLFWPGAE